MSRTFSPPELRDRSQGIASTDITNEINRAIRGMAPMFQSGQPHTDQRAFEVLWFQITEPIAGYGGRYLAKLFDFDVNSAVASLLQVSDLGSLSSGAVVEVWYPNEIGWSSHRLLAGFISFGRFLNQRSDDDKYIVLMAGDSSGVVQFKLTDSHTKGAAYVGVLITPSTSSISPTGAFTEADLFSVTTTEIIAVNTRELGEDTHDLANSGFLPLIFFGWYTGRTLTTESGEVPIVAFDGLQWEDC